LERQLQLLRCYQSCWTQLLLLLLLLHCLQQHQPAQAPNQQQPGRAVDWICRQDGHDRLVQVEQKLEAQRLLTRPLLLLLLQRRMWVTEPHLPSACGKHHQACRLRLGQSYSTAGNARLLLVLLM
jgi:hypothetical protein